MNGKIPVHEIDGDYYCAIDDIAVAVSKITSRPRTRESCLAGLIQEYGVYIHYKSRVERGNLTSHHSGGRCLGVSNLGRGVYKVARWYIEDPLIDEKRAPSNSDTRPRVVVSDLYIRGSRGGFRTKEDVSAYALLEGQRYKKKPRYNPTAEPIYPLPEDCYLSFADTQIYLYQYGKNIDFIMPNTSQAEPVEQAKEQPETEVTTPKTEPIAEATPEIEIAPYLDRDNPSHAPLLAVAIDVWERLFIHNEGNPKIGLEPRAIELIERHYPHLTTEKEKKHTAYVATTHLGKKEKSQKSENNG